MENRYIPFIVVLTLFCFLVSALPGAVSAYTTSFSPDGKDTNVTFNSVTSTLHYDVTTAIKTGTWGHGKYTTVLVTGTDNKGRNVYRKVNYYNDLFIQSKLQLKSSDGYVYNSLAKRNGSHIIESINGKLNSTFTFKGSINGTLSFVKGQIIHKNASATIKYWNNGIYFGKTITNTTPTYKKYGASYKIIKTTTSSNTYYTNSDTRTSVITSLYLRNSHGEQIGLTTTGTSRGSEQVGTKIANYTGKINIKTRQDPKDLYNEKFNTGNYSEHRNSTSSTLNKKRIPVFEALIY